MFDSGYGLFAETGTRSFPGCGDWDAARLDSGVIESALDFAIYATLWLKLVDDPSIVHGLRDLPVSSQSERRDNLLAMARNGGTWPVQPEQPP